MSSSNKIFNVEEPSGKDKVALETTAAEARIEAPNPVVAHQVDVNAEEAHEAAQQAAAHAKAIGSTLTGEPTTAAGQFKADASKTTNAAVEEGKRDVDQAKATGAGYVEQAKQLASSAVETAQAYIPSTIAGKPVGEIAATVQNTAAGAYTTVKETAQPHLEKVVNAAQGYVGAIGVQGKDAMSPGGDLGEQGKDLSGRAPSSATTAPLESGPHTVDAPYSSGVAPKIANTDQTATEGRPLSHN